MLQRSLRFLAAPFFFAVVALAWFRATAFAATAATGDEGSVIDLARPVYDAFVNHHPALGATLLVVLLVALVKRYAPGKAGTFVHNDLGGSLLALIGGGALAMSIPLAVPGATWSWGLLKGGFEAGLLAAGGYAALKNLVVEPLLKPLAARFPALSWLFDLIFWMFDHVVDAQADAAKKADAAGDAAVKAAPAQGAAAVLGAPAQLP